MYYYDVRYLDPKYSRWISTDPALGDYLPSAPVSEEARRHNQNLPGMGGVFNHINGDLYAYGANNPIRYTDPDGRQTVGALDLGEINQNLDLVAKSIPGLAAALGLSMETAVSAMAKATPWTLVLTFIFCLTRRKLCT